MIHHVLLIVSMLVAILSPIISSYIKIPLVIIEFLMGIIFGLIFSNQIPKSPDITFLSTIGFIVLMFMAGFEIDFDFIEESSLRELIFAATYVISLIPFSLLVGSALGLGIHYSIVIPLISVGLGLPILKESGVSETFIGQKLLIMGSIGEIISIIYISFLDTYLKVGILGAFTKILWTYSIFTILILILKAIKPKIREYRRLIKNISLENTHIFIRIALFASFIFASVFQLIGMEPILGAMLSGAMLGYIIRKKDVINKSFYDMAFGFFIPLFFVYTGISLKLVYADEKVLLSGFMIGIALLITRFGVSFILLLAGFRISNLPFASLFLSFPFTLLIASIKILSDAKYINDEQSVGILVGALFSSLFYPIVFKFLSRFYLNENETA